LVGCYLIYFFFQAEDGIRYRNVTGVQTCALPIYRSGAGGCGDGEAQIGQAFDREDHMTLIAVGDRHEDRARGRQTVLGSCLALEIGRASCRERGVEWGGRRGIDR